MHFYRNVFTAVPQGKRKEVAAMLKAIHAQEDRPAAREKAQAVVATLHAMRFTRRLTVAALLSCGHLLRDVFGNTFGKQ